MSGTGDFVISNGVLEKYSGPGGAVVIPVGVTEIGPAAFDHCRSLTELTLPRGVTHIGKRAFASCWDLRRVTLPEGLTGIGYEAFSNCEGLTELTLPEGLRSVGDRAFYCCSGMRRVTLPESVTRIGVAAFAHCESLTEVTIPKGVRGVAMGAFSCCMGLRRVTIPEGVTGIGDKAFSDCAELRDVSIPESMARIGESAFEGCGALRCLSFPDGLKAIGPGALTGCRCDVRVRHWLPSLTGALGWHFGVRLHTDDPIEAIPESCRPAAVLGFAAEDPPDTDSPRARSYFRWLTAHAAAMLPGPRDNDPDGPVPDAFGNPELLRLLCMYGLIPPELSDAYLAAAEELGDVHLKALVLEGLRRSGPARPWETPEEDDPHGK